MNELDKVTGNEIVVNGKLAKSRGLHIDQAEAEIEFE